MKKFFMRFLVCTVFICVSMDTFANNAHIANVTDLFQSEQQLKDTKSKVESIRKLYNQLKENIDNIKDKASQQTDAVSETGPGKSSAESENDNRLSQSNEDLSPRNENPSQDSENSSPVDETTSRQMRTCFTKDVVSSRRFIPPKVDNNTPVYWWVGDSRFTGMYMNEIIGRNDNEAVVANAGQGYRWFTSSPAPTGMSLLESCLQDGDVVVLGLGINDMYNQEKYIKTYQNLMQKYPNVTFKVLSVNPVNDVKAAVTNDNIEDFNEQLKNAFSTNYIDTYSDLKDYVNENAGYTDNEGLHYRGGGIEQMIYNTVMSM